MESAAQSIGSAAPGSVYEHMAVLSDPLRCRMLLVMEQHELTVSELCSVLQLPQSTVSRHLKTLGDDGWVQSRKEGTSRYYRVDLKGLAAAPGRLWPIVREQASGSPSARQDSQRLTGVLARRRSQSRAFFSSSAARWDRVREELFGNRFHLHALVALIEPSLVVGDLGCGTGPLTALLASHVERVIAVDGSSEMLAEAQHRLGAINNVELRRGELEALPIDDGSLGLALLVLVLHHLPEPARALAEAARVLRPGGRLLLVDMLPHDRVDYRQQMGHVWLGFTPEQVSELLLEAGFAGIKTTPLPAQPEARGPALFVATARLPVVPADNATPPFDVAQGTPSVSRGEGAPLRERRKTNKSSR